MIKTQLLTPEIYYRDSRDFQLIGRIYDVIFNYLKTNTSGIGDFPLSENTDRRFLELLATTLGFKIKHHYSDRQLLKFCSVFSEAVKNKGSIKAITLAVKALLSSENIIDVPEISISALNPFELDIFISEEFSDLNLMKDLLDYILPAGMTCRIIQATLLKGDASTKTVEESIGTSVHAVSNETSFIPKLTDLTNSTLPDEIKGPSGQGGGRIDIAVIPDIDVEA